MTKNDNHDLVVDVSEWGMINLSNVEAITAKYDAAGELYGYLITYTSGRTDMLTIDEYTILKHDLTKLRYNIG